MSGHEQALCELLDVSEPAVTSDYPDSLRLPEFVHHKMLGALAHTAEDDRERSLHFRYHQGQWQVSREFKSPKFQVAAAKPVFISLLGYSSTFFKLPHLNVHTHPTPSETAINLALVVTADREQEEKSQASIATLRRVYEISTPFPSSGDVFGSILRSPASIGNLVAAEHGSFLWVRRDIGRKKRLIDSVGRGFLARLNLAYEASGVVADSDEAIIEGLTDLSSARQSMLESRVMALSPYYVCYVSEDPHDPVLTKAG